MPDTAPDDTPVETFLNAPAEWHAIAYGLALGIATTTPILAVQWGIVILLFGTELTAAGTTADRRVLAELRAERQYAIIAFLVGMAVGILHGYIHPSLVPPV